MRILSALIFSYGLFLNCLGQEPPQRIVSLAPSITRSLYYLDGENLLVGITTFCTLAPTSDAEVIGSALEVNIEKVIALNPDLVLTTAMTNPETITMLRRAGITVRVFQTPKSFTEVCKQFEYLGNLIGKGKLAAKINTDVRKSVEGIRSQHQYQKPPRFFFQIGANPLFTVLENTFMDDFITIFGGRNIAKGLKTGIINREFVLKSNPDVILIMDMGITGEHEKKTWKNYPFMSAVKSGRIFILESETASSANPPDFLKTLKEIAVNLRPGWWRGK